MQKVEAMYTTETALGGRTALTFFYEGEPSESNNCIDTSGGGNDMFSWIHTNFLDSPTTETEAIRLGVNYVLISWYPDQCPGENPNWPVVYTKLGQVFPNAKVGFGELGTAKPQNGSAFEKNEIDTIYPLKAGVGGLPSNYISGVRRLDRIGQLRPVNSEIICLPVFARDFDPVRKASFSAARLDVHSPGGHISGLRPDPPIIQRALV
jgi:hypothetical protein